MSEFLRTHGLPTADIVLEDQSRTTYENAVLTARLLRARDLDEIVLITDALHMARAERCFRSQGIKVVPVGCRHRTTQFNWSILIFLPTFNALEDMHGVAHEWLGIFWYVLKSRITWGD